MSDLQKKIFFFFGFNFLMPMFMHWFAVLLEWISPRGDVHGADHMIIGLQMVPQFMAFLLIPYWPMLNWVARTCLLVVLSLWAIPISVFVVSEQTTTDYIIPLMSFVIAPTLALLYIPYDSIAERCILEDLRNKQHEPGNESIGRGSLS